MYVLFSYFSDLTFDVMIILGITASAALNLGTFGLEQPSIHKNQGMY